MTLYRQWIDFSVKGCVPQNSVEQKQPRKNPEQITNLKSKNWEE